ncbi:uncharacterized protein LOC129614084 [Condylostylus longicornis]|uniref:uncharacterized protein LOC129614084 n=1 Tax=Condylostylus longicornis TaxID=2530218 RepID=UPI00244DFE63|nr:uncharacterized protein LOC129614084 [Condylostylus longicornis]
MEKLDFYLILIFVCINLNFITNGQETEQPIVEKQELQSERTAQLANLLGRCRLRSETFNSCMKNVFNDLRIFFPTGIPEYNIKPFDPHKCSFVQARRGDRNGFGGFILILRNVSEYGWTNSKVTKFRMNEDQNKFVYSQYFPDKGLDGYFEFNGKMFGRSMKNYGVWNLSLSDYSQTTTIRRLGGPGSILKVNVVVDRIGGMELHISNFFGRERDGLNNFADTVINSMWQLGLPFIKPLINELVSTAFTDIFNESFRYFPVQDFMT